MRLRSAEEVRSDIAHVSACLATFDDTTHWADALMVDRYQGDLRELRDELTRSEFVGLQVVLDGAGIYEHTIATDRLTGFLGEFQRSMRNVAASEVRGEGESFTEVERALTDVHLASLFDGSVGLKLVAPPGSAFGEQLDMLRPPLFDRTVERVLDVLAAAQEPEGVEEAVLELAVDLSADAIVALKNLAKSMGAAGAPTRFAWHGTLTAASKVVTLVPGQASELVSILEAATPIEVPLDAYGLLSSVDSHDGSFHLVTDSQEYRGVVAAGQLHEAQERVYRYVQVEMIEQSVTGRFARRSRPKYTLVNFPA